MKLNFGANGDFREGYVNIDINPERPEITKIDFRNLDAVAKDESVEEIVAKHVLEFVSTQELRVVLEGWKRKLSMGGQLFIMGIDINMLANQVNWGQLDIESLNNLLYQPNLLVRPTAVYSLSVIKALLENMGFFIETKFATPDNQYGIKAIKR